MTEHDGLTAEQEAERRWPVVTYDLPPYADMFSTMARRHFVEGAEWATEREKARIEGLERDNNTLSKGVRVLGHELAHEKARAEAAEARVAELEARLNAARIGRESQAADHARAWAEAERLRDGVLNFVNAWDEDMSLDSVGDSVDQYLRPAIATPTTEAVTE